MSSERTRVVQQEKTVLIGIGVLIIVALATLAFHQFRANHADDVKVPDTAPLSVAFGDTTAQLRVIVYTDPVCDKCAAYHEDVVMPLYRDYVKSGHARLEIRPLGIVSADSAKLNELLMCSNEQHAYMKTSKYVFDAVHKGDDAAEAAAQFFDIHSTEDIAAASDIDAKKLVSCLDGDTYTQKASQADAQAYAADIYSAPTTIVGDSEPVRGYSTYAYIKSLIEAARH